MDEDSYVSFMALHTHPIEERLAEMREITKREALDLLYRSDLYRLYEQEKTKLWHFSNVALADLLNHEIASGHAAFFVEG